MCINRDAGMPTDADGGDGRDARDVADEPKFNCNQCEAGANNVCDMDASRCVECLSDGDCGGDGSLNKVCDLSSFTCVGCLPTDNPCTGTTPICSNKVCRPCVDDSQCDLAVCMKDGHCAGSGEVIFVDYSAATCPGDGLSATPFCSIPAAMPSLNSNRHVIVIRGPADDKLMLATTDVLPVIVGKKNLAGADASIPAGAGTAILASSDQVLIRDLTATGGTADTSKGILASGSTKITLVNVRANLTTGLGIQADSGAQLTMDRCTVVKNSVGGLLINGAGYDIQNSVFAENGFSQIQFSSTPNPGTPSFRFNTVVATSGNAATCDVNNKRPLSDSIIMGGQNCTVVNSRTAATFKASPAYHLSAPIGCPEMPVAPVPTHDIDNEVRMSPLDCGADQFVQ